MFDLILKSQTGLFIGDTFLKCVWIESIAWKDERAALVSAECVYGQKEYIDQIVDGVTIDLMNGCGAHDRNDRRRHTPVLSMVDIYDVEKVMWNPVIAGPDDEDRLTISVFFSCSLEFASEEIESV